MDAVNIEWGQDKDIWCKVGKNGGLGIYNTYPSFAATFKSTHP